METDKTIVCSLCEKEVNDSEAISIGVGSSVKKICEPCYEKNDGYSCNHCSNSFLEKDLQYYETNEGDIICEDCYSDDFFTCQSCEEVYDNDNGYYCDNCDNGTYCEGCFSDHERNCGRGDDWVDNETRDCTFLTANTSKEEGKIIKSTRLFGVEIEAHSKGIKSREDMSEFAKKLNKSIGLCQDGSVNDCGGVAMELQTPPASGKNGEALINDTTKLLRQYKFGVDDSCGLHVHIDGNDFVAGEKPLFNAHLQNVNWLSRMVAKTKLSSSTIDEVRQAEEAEERRLYALKSLFMFYITFENVIISFLPQSRRLSRFCKLLQTELSLRSIDKCDSEDRLAHLWYNTRTDDELRRRKEQKYDDSRYYGVNFHSLFAAGHLEIRYHSGTINPEKILNWANLHLRIVDKAAALELPTHLGEYASFTTSLTLDKKAKVMFDILDLSQEARAYFLDRMKKFNFGMGYQSKIEE